MDEREEIKARLPIEEVVGRQVDLKRAGTVLRGLCPFHDEKTPSFIVTPARGTFHCFGCGKHGDIFTFLMETEKLDFPEALKRLADQAGIRLPEKAPQKASLRARLFAANMAAADFYRDVLNGQQGERARRYLEERAFDQEAIDAFDLGYSPERRDSLSQHLRGLGFDDRILLTAGLIIQDEIGSKPRDRFHGRLMFPIRDQGGRVTGFGGRTLGDLQPKYLNSPQTEVFDKSSVLYGLHRSVEAIRKEGTAVLVEGYLDAIRAQVKGKANVVASLGTAVTLPQLAALSRLANTVVIALDPDPAGQGAAARAALNALAELTRTRGRTGDSAGTVDLRIARLPEGKGDPDDLLRGDTVLWEAAINEALPAFDFYFERTLAGLDRSSEEWRQQAINILLPLIRQFSTSVGWQAIWIERLARETGMSPGTLERAAMPGAPKRRAKPRNRALVETVTNTTARGLTRDPVAHVERALLGLLLTIVVVPSEAASKLIDVSFEHHDNRTLLNRLLEWRATENYDYDEFREALPEELQDYADELRATAEPLPDDQAFSLTVNYHLTRHRQFVHAGRLQRAYETLQELAEDDREVAYQEVSRLLEERHQIDQELQFMSMLTGKVGTGRPRA